MTLVNAAVSVVLPWSTCPIVPTLTCGLVRSNFSLATAASSQKTSGFLGNGGSDVRRHFHVLRELHRVRRAALTHRAHRGRILEHLLQGDFRCHDLAGHRILHAEDVTTTAVQVADDVAVVV